MRDADKQMLADHYIDLYRIAFSMLHNEADAEDAVQEALVVTMTRQLWGNPFNYCVGVLRRICIKMLSKKSELLLGEYWDIPEDEEDPDRRRLQHLMDVMDELPSRNREILLMHYVDGCSKAEIAKKKGISVTMVKKIFRKGEELLKQLLIETEKNDKDIFKP